MTRRIGFGLVAWAMLCVMLSALAYAIPAAWVAQRLAGASNGRVQLAHARGLWHRGSGILVLSSARGGADAVHWTQALHWHVAAVQWPLLWVLRVSLPEVGPPLAITLRLGLSGWATEIAPWRGVVPLAALAGLGAPFNTLALEGDAQIGLAAMAFASAVPAKPVTSPNVEIQIKQLRSALAQGVVLGDYVVQGKAGAGAGSFVLRTAQGILQLDGQGHCSSASRLSCSFEGTARAARRDDALIGNLLGLVGKPRNAKNQQPDEDHVTELRW
jgi:general secretion pathway protein N